MPWDQNTLPGWIGEAFFSILATFAFCLIIPPILSLFVSICEYHCAFYKMFRHQITKINAAGYKPMPIARIKDIIQEAILLDVSSKMYEITMIKSRK